MAYTYGPASPVVMMSPYHSHGAYPYSFWEGRSGMPYGRGMGYGMPYGGMGRGMLGFPPSAMLSGGRPMRFTRFPQLKGNGEVKDIQIFPVLRTFMRAARDYEALDRSNLIQEGKRKYQLKRMPALKGSLKGIGHYIQDPFFAVGDMIRERRNEIAKEHERMSQDGYEYAELDRKTKNLKRGFKWGLDGEGYASHLVEKLTHLNNCYNAGELTEEQYKATVQNIISDLEDFRNMKAITEAEYGSTLGTIRSSVIVGRGRSL